MQGASRWGNSKFELQRAFCLRWFFRACKLLRNVSKWKDVLPDNQVCNLAASFLADAILPFLAATCSDTSPRPSFLAVSSTKPSSPPHIQDDTDGWHTIHSMCTTLNSCLPKEWVDKGSSALSRSIDSVSNACYNSISSTHEVLTAFISPPQNSTPSTSRFLLMAGLQSLTCS